MHASNQLDPFSQVLELRLVKDIDTETGTQLVPR